MDWNPKKILFDSLMSSEEWGRKTAEVTVYNTHKHTHDHLTDTQTHTCLYRDTQTRSVEQPHQPLPGDSHFTQLSIRLFSIYLIKPTHVPFNHSSSSSHLLSCHFLLAFPGQGAVWKWGTHLPQTKSWACRLSTVQFSWALAGTESWTQLSLATPVVMTDPIGSCSSSSA